MVALGLELLALEVGQSVDLIEVVVGVAVGGEGEAAGVEGLQLLHGFVGEAADHQGLALPAAVGDDALQNGADVAAAGGVEVLVHAPVDEALAEIALHLGHLSIVGRPEIEVGEGVLRAPVAGGLVELLDPGAVGQGGFFTLIHSINPFHFVGSSRLPEILI